MAGAGFLRTKSRWSDATIRSYRSLGRGDATCIAQEQRRLQRAFQIGNPLADNRFRQVQMRRRGSDSAKLHHCEEGFNFVQRVAH